MWNKASIKYLQTLALVILAIFFIRSSLDALEIRPFAALTLFLMICVEIRGALRQRSGGLSREFSWHDFILLPAAGAFGFPLFVIFQTVKPTPILLALAPVLFICFWGGKAPLLKTPSGVLRNLWLPVIVLACICTWWLRYNQFTMPECEDTLKDGCPGARWINYNAGRNFVFLIPDENYLLSLKCFDSFADKMIVTGPKGGRYPRTPVSRKMTGGCALAIDTKRDLILIADPLTGKNNVFKKSDFTKIREFKQYAGRTDTRKHTYHKISYLEKSDVIANISARREISLFSARNYKHIKTITIPEPPGFSLIYKEYIFSALPVGDKLVMGTWAGELLVFDINKNRLTQRKWMGLPVQFLNKNSSEDKIFAVIFGSNLVTLNAKDLRIVKKMRLPAGSRSATVWPEENRVFTQSYFDGNLYMLSYSGGNVIDKRRVGGGNGLIQADYKNKIIYIGTECGVFGFRFTKNGFSDGPDRDQCKIDSEEIFWQKKFYPTHSLRNIPVTDMSAGSFIIYLHMLWDDLAKQSRDIRSALIVLLISLWLTRHIAAARGIPWRKVK